MAILGYLLTHPEKVGWVRERLKISELISSPVAQLLSSIFQAAERGETFTPASLIDGHPELAGLITRASFGAKEPEEALIDYVRAIRRKTLKRRMAQLKSQMEEVEKRGDEVKGEELLKEYRMISTQLEEKP